MMLKKPAPHLVSRFRRQVGKTSCSGNNDSKKSHQLKQRFEEKPSALANASPRLASTSVVKARLAGGRRRLEHDPEEACPAPDAGGTFRMLQEGVRA
jgi:hypothetical protein